MRGFPVTARAVDHASSWIIAGGDDTDRFSPQVHVPIARTAVNAVHQADQVSGRRRVHGGLDGGEGAASVRLDPQHFSGSRRGVRPRDQQHEQALDPAALPEYSL
jgi:hypothetical protein